MPVYTYEAKNFEGETIRGEYETPSVDSLKLMLEGKGYYLTTVKKKHADVTFGLFEKVNIKDLAIFCRQFQVVMQSGIPIVEAIAILMEQNEKKLLKQALEDIHESLQKGMVLSEAMNEHRKIFPEFMISMIKVGEVSGTIDEILEKLADFYDRENGIRKKVRTAMTYPIILLVLTVGVVILLMTYVLPMFSGILSQMGGDMPMITVVLIGISNFMVDNIFALFIVIGGIIFIIYYYLKTDNGKFLLDSLKLSLPIIKVTNLKLITSRFSRSMSILLKSGIPVVEAIELMQDLIGNRVVQKRFGECRDQIQQGRGLSRPLENINIFPPMLIHMIAVGEQTGELDEMLSRTSTFFDAEVEEAIDKMVAMIEPLMIVILAAVVGTIILSVMLPMVSIMNTIG